ncbi:hypothetical protein L228DRAFT_239419 [Xylona heveae TC161]|uniref:MARVEL domain-containing protein n=1 Tax=Xylona heveae (strain CBS 132557 / TC161) TaxID=1328760 RepID=A0A165GQ34_XYLHT|nr:hypothetical protein L228DRAFT_239419 [Xylona heveae TC161]KZF22457.1 hypothetical protein L228DRAFT_239419 [Xylona heveae TC161]
MRGPNYGALGMTFTLVRGLQAVALIAIIGMTANFISEMVSSNTAPPSVLVGTLVITCIAVLYCAITYILYFDIILPFLLNAIMDSSLLIAVIVVAVTVGKPLSYLNCQAITKTSNDGSSAYAFTESLGSSLDKDGGKVNYSQWAGATKVNCYEMKSIWGMSIALCILFAFSAICSLCLWRRTKNSAPKSVEEA